MNLPFPVPSYYLRQGTTLDKAILVKFMQRAYQEIFPDTHGEGSYQNFAHLATTVEQYFCRDTPIWWVYPQLTEGNHSKFCSPIAGLWAGNAIDQITGNRHAHIFLVYVEPEHRRRGIATALIQHLETWAKRRGDRQIGLQVFQINTPAINLYHHLGYQTQSLWMVKSL
ncbi:GNAT family N-acetyltransferase [Anabaena sp. FACHB-1237]|uniref:GNAT family N-acetyltransferase n=1 Tax=Anabaena sp. FACHB-1237 TaxID=2692769 RepID=UPI0037C08345